MARTENHQYRAAAFRECIWGTNVSAGGFSNDIGS
jgi:hypothetical protein